MDFTGQMAGPFIYQKREEGQPRHFERGLIVDVSVKNNLSY